MPVINVMLKPASGLCNMRCGYCFYADEMDKRGQASYGIMSGETLEHVIRETLFFAEGECTFAFQGGEPTLAGLDFYRKSMELQRKYNVNHAVVRNVIQTNGYGLNEEWCDFLRENRFLVGLSLDGIKSTHDAYRRGAEGEDTYFRILDAAKLLEGYGVEYNILTVVNSRTAPKIRRIYEQYQKQGFRYQQYIACLDPLGEAPGGREYSLTPQAYGQFLSELFELWDIDLRKGTQPYIRQFENWVGILLGTEPEACEQRGFCNIQNVVEADGSVYPCDFYALDEYRLGNLNTDSFKTVYENRRRLGFVEQSRNHTKGCLECGYFPVCRGGCRRHRNDPAPDGEGCENYFCQAYRVFFDRHYERLCEIARMCRGC